MGGTYIQLTHPQLMHLHPHCYLLLKKSNNFVFDYIRKLFLYRDVDKLYVTRTVNFVDC